MTKLKRTPKRIGELAELAFLHRATAEGLIVSHPYGDSAPFDFITLGNGKMCRVQVKCTTHAHHERGNRISCRKNVYPEMTSYTREDIDFVVVHVVEADVWYILPPAVFINRTSIVLPIGNDRLIRRAAAKLEQYQEAWHLLFDREAAGFTLHASAEFC